MAASLLDTSNKANCKEDHFMPILMALFWKDKFKMEL
jgi:hypothetical protein